MLLYFIQFTDYQFTMVFTNYREARDESGHLRSRQNRILKSGPLSLSFLLLLSAEQQIGENQKVFGFAWQ